MADYRGLALGELRVGSARWAIVATVSLGVGLLLLVMSVHNPIESERLVPIAGLFLVAAIAYLALQYRVPLAVGMLVGGLLAVVILATGAWPGAVVAPWAALVVLAVVAPLGWRWGAGAALVVTGLLIATARQPGGPIPVDVAVNAICLTWATLMFSVLTSWPARTVLDWAWSSYLQALDQTEAARDHQAEFARLSKSLGESYYRLEQLNLELERTRRAAQRAHELKSQFAVSVSHELRTPLNLIIGFCEMMVLSPDSAYGQRLPSGYKGDLEAIYRNACHISSLIDDILDLSQIDADRMALHREWTTLPQIVEEAISTVETLFRDRELVLQTAFAPDTPPIFADPTRVRQILINLLANAARFTEKGGVTIHARREDQAVIVAVSDTGPGIPEDQQPHVFDEFRQVQGSRWERGGSGLGLAVSKRFAELHDGTMWVESELGAGSTFYLKLPVVTDEPGAPVDDRMDWADWIGRRVRGQAEHRILVIDDSGEVRKVFQRYLDGFRVLDLAEVFESHEQGKGAPVHAVVLGSPSARDQWCKVQHQAPDLSRLPVLSCDLHTSRRLADDMGVLAYLVKPVTRIQIRSALRQLGEMPKRVLVVDDDPEMLRLLVRMLRSFLPGCELQTARDGRQALDLLQESGADLLLLDLLMPTVDGYSVLQGIRDDPGLKGLPVIVVTARGLQDETVVASLLSLSRDGGLTVAEVVRWLASGLDAILQLDVNEPAPRAKPGG